MITIKRAYLELEREGVIVTQHGKGCIVAADPKETCARASRRRARPHSPRSCEAWPSWDRARGAGEPAARN